MKKFLILAIVPFLFACNSDRADITLYYMPGCPHCHYAMDFFSTEIPTATVDKINITEGGKAMDKFNAALKKCKMNSRGVPLMIVKGECMQGYSPEVGQKIKAKLGL